MSAPTKLFVMVAVEYYFVQGMVPGTVVLTCETALPFSARLPVPFEWGAPGRMAPVGSECASQRRAVSRVPTSLGWRDTGSESRGRSRKQRFGPGLPIGETAWRRLVPEASAPVEEVGQRT